MKKNKVQYKPQAYTETGNPMYILDLTDPNKSVDEAIEDWFEAAEVIKDEPFYKKFFGKLFGKKAA